MDKKEWDALYISHQNWKEFICEMLDKKQIQDEETIQQIQLEIYEIDQLLKRLEDK
jgi:hypothetical protein